MSTDINKSGHPKIKSNYPAQKQLKVKKHHKLIELIKVGDCCYIYKRVKAIIKSTKHLQLKVKSGNIWSFKKVHEKGQVVN